MDRPENHSFTWAAWLGGAVALGGAAAAATYLAQRRPMVSGVVAGVGASAAALGAWELAWWLRRRARRGLVFKQARAEATRLNRPLVVIGAPDAGTTSNYGCGDVTVDIAGSSCPNSLTADISLPLPFAADSVVCAVFCVLEYVDNFPAAVAELQRVSGGNVFYASVEPWTLTGLLHPGRKRSLPAAMR